MTPDNKKIKLSFKLLSNYYKSKTSLPIILIDKSGNTICTKGRCNICKKNNISIPELCRKKMIMSIEESLRWGEPYISRCPLGLILFSIALVRKNNLLGGLISGFVIFPEMKKDFCNEIINNLAALKIKIPDNLKISPKIIKSREANKFSLLLLNTVKKFKFSDMHIFNEQKLKSIQQYSIANFFEYLRNNEQEISKVVVDKQQEIIDKVKLGDRQGTIELLNQFMGSIFYESKMEFNVLKVRLIEFVVIISRAAIESGADSNDIFGKNYSLLTDINKTENIEDLCYYVTVFLEKLISNLAIKKGKKKRIELHKMEVFIKENFTRKLNIDEIAKAANLSISRAQHLFKEEKRYSIIDYIQRLRINYCKYLILNSELDLASISLQAGYYDQSHFYRYFKKFENLSPNQFRQKFKIGSNLET